MSMYACYQSFNTFTNELFIANQSENTIYVARIGLWVMTDKMNDKKRGFCGGYLHLRAHAFQEEKKV